MDDETRRRRDLARDESNHAGIRKDAGKRNRAKRTQEVRGPLDPRKRSRGEAVIQGEEEDSAARSLEPTASSTESENAQSFSPCTPFYGD